MNTSTVLQGQWSVCSASGEYEPIGPAGDIPEGYADDDLRIIKTHFNILTNDNVLKATVLHPQAETWNFARADKLVDWCAANGVAVHGHTLVWGQTPAWFFEGRDKETIIKRMKDHIGTVVGRYKGRCTGGMSSTTA